MFNSPFVTQITSNQSCALHITPLNPWLTLTKYSLFASFVTHSLSLSRPPLLFWVAGLSRSPLPWMCRRSQPLSISPLPVGPPASTHSFQPFLFVALLWPPPRFEVCFPDLSFLLMGFSDFVLQISIFFLLVFIFIFYPYV